ncbi:MAG: hypothetical protein IKT40_08945 [Bacilli bacterium]|nr:hypothetical protein [Bacilli bacterium]
MRKRKLNENIKNVLNNNFIDIFKRYVKESESLDAFSIDMEVINQRSYAWIREVGGSKIEKLNDLVNLEIKWYERGGNSYPNSFSYAKYNNGLTTKRSKYAYIVGYFIDDFFGSSLLCSKKEDITEELVDVLVKI